MVARPGSIRAWLQYGATQGARQGRLASRLDVGASHIEVVEEGSISARQPRRAGLAGLLSGQGSSIAGKIQALL